MGAGDGAGANFAEAPPGEGVVTVRVAFFAVVALTVVGAEVVVGSSWGPGVHGQWVQVEGCEGYHSCCRRCSRHCVVGRHSLRGH